MIPFWMFALLTLALPVTAQDNTVVEDEGLLKAEICRGLEEDVNPLWIPSGNIEIMSSVSSFRESGSTQWIDNYKTKKFNEKFLEHLKWCQAKGLVTIAERQFQSVWEERLSGGSRFVTVIPTNLAKQESDPDLAAKIASKGYVDTLVIRTGSCEVLQIIRSTPYQAPRLSPSEEHRLVLGTYRTRPSDFYRSVNPEPDGQYKFRAVLRHNPFTKRYSLTHIDVGYIEKDGWWTNNVGSLESP